MLLPDDSRVGDELVCGAQALAKAVNERIIPVQRHPALHEEHVEGMPLPHMHQFVLQDHLGQRLDRRRKNEAKKRGRLPETFMHDERAIAKLTPAAFADQR